MVSLTIAGASAALIWAYLLVGRGGFWRIGRILVRPGGEPQATRRVAVIVPARNEAAVVSRSIASLLLPAGEKVHIFLVDDASSDNTAQIARQAAVSAGKPGPLTILEGRPLPPGWSGKLWAVSQGIEAAGAFVPDFLLLSDADVVHAPATIPSLLAIAEGGGYDLVSFMVKLHCRSLAEKLLIPPFVFFFFKLYPPSWISDPNRATAGAAGGCLLIRPEALARAGGMAAIRGEIIDDCALARAVKRSGGKVWLGMTEGSVSIRPYGSFAEIGRMVSRSAFNQLHHSALMLLGAVVGLSVTYLLPVGLLLSGYAIPIAMGGLAWAGMTAAFLPTVRSYQLNPLWALTLPVAALFYMGATIHSAIRFWLGRGGEWKGRAQDRAQAAPDLR
jgi:hopene-associated glycosyltransferase HpnB